MAKNTGGSAFPHDEYSTQSEQFRAMNYQESGMTLRDYFAAKSLAMLADPNLSGNAENIAISAYQIADAMIAERAK